MGLSNGSGIGFNGPLFLLSPRTKDAEGAKCKPHFTADTKDPATGELARVAETYTQVGGDLFRAEIKTRTFSDRTAEEPVLWFKEVTQNEGEDPVTTAYRLPLSNNSASRDLLNRFATLLDTGDFTGLTVDYYENKKGYDTYALKQRGERVEWKYDRAVLPAPIEILHPRTGAVEKRDYADVDAFFKQVVLAIAETLKGNPTPAPEPLAPTEPTGHEGGQQEEAAPEAEAPAPAPTPAPKPTVVAPRPAARPVAAVAKPAATPAPAPKPAAPKPAAPAPKAAAPATRPVAAKPVARPVAKPVAQPAVAPGDSALDQEIPF